MSAKKENPVNGGSAAFMTNSSDKTIVNIVTKKPTPKHPIKESPARSSQSINVNSKQSLRSSKNSSIKPSSSQKSQNLKPSSSQNFNTEAPVNHECLDKTSAVSS
jgi:hypothetical protein